MMRHFSWIAAAGVLAALLNAAPPVTAQSVGGFFGEQDGLFAISEKRDKTFLDAGVAYVNRSPFVGSSDTDNLVLPFARTDYKGRLFINPALGAGVYWRNTDNIRVSTSLNFALGRDGEDTPFIGEAGEIDSSFAVTNAVRVYLPIAAFDAISTVPFTGGFQGARLDTLLTTEIKPIKGLRITPGVRATFGTAGWIGSLYNIDSDALPAVGQGGVNFPDLPGADFASLEAFQSSGGLIALGAHTAAYYELPNNFQLIGVVNYSALQGDAKDSPLSVENSGLTLAVALAKHF